MPNAASKPFIPYTVADLRYSIMTDLIYTNIPKIDAESLKGDHRPNNIHKHITEMSQTMTFSQKPDRYLSRYLDKKFRFSRTPNDFLSE